MAKKSKKVVKEPLVVTSKIKAYVRACGGMCASDLPAAVSDAAYGLLDKAIARAKANKRSTVRPFDL
ncbi:MAG: hypothetical protein JXP34_13935 [Planctomycetes bacterium]|nr:hypothetical protein [Planctomycetota bacterium]